MFLYCLTQTAKAISTDESNSHRKRIREDEAFYKNWLFPRFERFYVQQGWPVGDNLSSSSEESTAAKRERDDADPSDGHWCPSVKRKAASRLSCAPFGRKTGTRLRHAIKRLKPTRRRGEGAASPVEEVQPQVGGSVFHADPPIFLQCFLRRVACSEGAHETLWGCDNLSAS